MKDWTGGEGGGLDTNVSDVHHEKHTTSHPEEYVNTGQRGLQRAW